MQDEAVSPTIGVILMVVVVVAVAGLLFSGLQGEEQPVAAKGLPLLNHEHEDRISVARADPGQDWEDYAIRATAALHYRVGDEPATAGDPVVGTGHATLSGGPIRASQSIWFCGDTELQGVSVFVRDIAANAVVHQADFANVAAC